MSEQTRWNGKFLDSRGRVGSFRLTGPVAQGRGSLIVEVADRDGGHVSLEGEASLEVGGKECGLRARLGDGVDFEADLQRGDAGRYAEAAYVGTYRTTGADGGFPLQAGALVLWQRG